MTVAALYVDPNGVYANLPDVEVWDEQRDARLYDGPWPVVAHPPCARWCQLAPLVQHLHLERLGEKYRVGNDAGCFEAALAAVRRWGGVLEHPAYSLAWPKFDLPVPGRQGWTQSLFDPGIVTEVSQSAYGHPCRKRTWLYAVDVDPVELLWTEPRPTAQVSAFDHHRAQRLGLDFFTEHMPRVLSLCPTDPPAPGFTEAIVGGVRVAAWFRGKPAPRGTSRVMVTWEPVILRGGRQLVADDITGYVWDTLKAPPYLAGEKDGFAGSKPAGFTRWVFDLLGANATDSLDDLFPGSGMVAREWEAFTRQTRLAV